MRLVNILFAAGSLFFLACGEENSPVDSAGKNSTVADGTCSKDAVNIIIDRNQSIIVAHISNEKNDCSVNGDVFSFVGETRTWDLVYDYKFVGDTLILAARGDGYQEIVMVGGKKGTLSGRWKVISGYRYIDGSIVKEEESSSNDFFNISENCLFIEDNSLESMDYMESYMIAWIYDHLFSQYKFDHLSNAYGSELFTHASEHVASDKELYGITVLEKTRTSETISAFGQTVSISFSNIEYDSRYFIYSSYKAVVEANGKSCVYDYLYASEVPEKFCKAEYKDFIEIKEGKAVRVNNDNTGDFGICLSKLLQ